MGIAVQQQQDFDLGFMQRALELANVAREEGEVPVGAVVDAGAPAVIARHSRRLRRLAVTTASQT